MQYLAILGRQPELGLLELEIVIGAENLRPFGRQTAILDQSADINRLGGSQKIGRIIYRGPAVEIADAPIDWDLLPISGSKSPFGLSIYNVSTSQRNVMAMGLELKKLLKTRGSLRLVAPKTGSELTAAQLKFNKIIENGFELLVAVIKSEMIVALTEQVQDIDWYSERDYGRPARSAKVGMLPPKLAQIMVNTTTGPVYDPFCGTGVVLQEALLMGRPASGSDISPEMITSSRTNLDWLSQQKPIVSWYVDLADARTVELPKPPIAIVSEGYLGPNMSRVPSKSELASALSDMQHLLEKSLTRWARQLPTGTEVTITLPQWHTAGTTTSLNIIDRLPDLGYTLRSFTHADAKKLVYRRPDQIVGRQLLVIIRS